MKVTAAALQPFVGVVPGQQNHLHKPYKLLTLSKKKIPFTITPEMKAILRQSYEQRFDIKEEVGHLQQQCFHVLYVVLRDSGVMKSIPLIQQLLFVPTRYSRPKVLKRNCAHPFVQYTHHCI